MSYYCPKCGALIHYSQVKQNTEGFYHMVNMRITPDESIRVAHTKLIKDE